jgi:hypothetical protein
LIQSLSWPRPDSIRGLLPKRHGLSRGETRKS